MTLIHKATQVPAKIGDKVTSFRGEEGVLDFFRPPHKPSSEGKVCVKADGMSQENYCSVWGLKWINRN